MMTKKFPYTLSVITVSRNAGTFIASTFDSIRQQTNQSFEYIVIDGCSTDNTVDLIKENQNIIDHWLSEPDGGIADAMNKGVVHSQGEYILFLHADDRFADKNSITRALESIHNHTDLIAFDILFEESVIGRKCAVRTKGHSRGFGFYTNFKMPFQHPGVLCKRTLFDSLGGFDQQFKIAMDYDFLLRAYRAGATTSYGQGLMTIFRDSGVSSKKDWPSLTMRFNEEKKVHFKNCKSKPLFLIYSAWWKLYPLFRKMRFKVREQV